LVPPIYGCFTVWFNVQKNINHRITYLRLEGVNFGEIITPAGWMQQIFWATAARDAPKKQFPQASMLLRLPDDFPQFPCGNKDV
jgi:hypothetical protein